MIPIDGTDTLVIVGAGSLGQSYAALLADAGHQVAVLATPGTAADLCAAGTIQLSGVVKASVPVTAEVPAPAGAISVAKAAASIHGRCGVVFATKAHQLPRAIEDVATLPKVAWACGVQNGVVKDTILVRTYGRERVVGSSTILGARRVANGDVTVTALGTTYFGELGGGTSARVESIAAALTDARIPSIAVDDIESVIWSKACNATGAFGVSVLTGPQAPLIGYDPDLMRAFLSLARETAAVAAALGHPIANHEGLPPVRTWMERDVEEIVAELPPPPTTATATATARTYPSMLQDLMAGRQMEVEEVFGAIVAQGEAHGIPVPRLTLVRDLLRGLQPR
jgi:2-dehydropantoate 2-reductase